MYERILPQKDAAALLPGASYSVPGLFQFSSLLYQCLDEVKAKFEYTIPVKYLYGAPRVRWNCGRLLFRQPPVTRRVIEEELSRAVERGITPLLTFSAPTLPPEDFDDPVCNDILAVLDALRGGVIVSDPNLKAYIEARYPNIELHASVIMTAFAKQRDTAYYESLSENFSRYVVHPDDNHDTVLLSTLPKERAELILNERCTYQCAQRKDHYNAIVQEQAELIETNTCAHNFIENCAFIPERKQSFTKNRTIALTTEQAAERFSQGFHLFKLQGRLDDPHVFFFDFLRYTLESQVAFPAMFPVFSYAIRDYVKQKKRIHEGI